MGVPGIAVPDMKLHLNNMGYLSAKVRAMSLIFIIYEDLIKNKMIFASVVWLDHYRL